jgi:hypothetical protein
MIAPAVKKAGGEVVAEVQRRAPGVPVWIVLSLLAIVALGIYVGISYLGWRLSPVKPGPGLIPVATQGGEKNPGYAAPPVKKLAGVPRRTTTRPIQATPVKDLPAKEQGYAPVVAPAAGPDNVVRTEPELLTSSVVPPARGDTEVRTWLNPDGSAQNVLTPKREAFWGWAWKRIELEGRYGLLGNTAAKGTGRWLPLRVGDIHAGAEGSVATERDGVIRGEGMVIIRYEPFRDSYR